MLAMHARIGDRVFAGATAAAVQSLGFKAIAFDLLQLDKRREADRGSSNELRPGRQYRHTGLARDEPGHHLFLR